MSARLRVYLTVLVAAAVAVGAVVGLTIDTRTDVSQAAVAKGKPPLPVGLPAPYGPVIEKAFKDWPHGSINTMQQLGLQYSKNALVQYYRGIALIWGGYPADAEAALELAKKLGRNTIIQGEADVLLHSQYYQPPAGQPPYPVFQPQEKNVLLERGSLLQQEGHQESAEQVYAEAVKRNPTDPEAQVAVAIALFDEDNLTPTFSRLGTLTLRFPRSQSVHFYFGYVLAWTNQKDSAVDQFEQVVKLGPKTVLGQAADKLIAGILSDAKAKSSG